MKKIISIALILVLMFSVSASAEGWRIYPSKESKNVKDTSMYAAYWDFTDVEEGLLPSGVTAQKSGATTAIYDVDGKKKNCLRIDDTDYSKTWTGVGANFNVSPVKGLAEFKIRFKYIKPAGGECEYGQYTLYCYDSTGQQLSYVVISSVNGATRFNPGGNGETDIEPAMISNDTWYTITMVYDFDKDEMDIEVLNEGTQQGFTRSSKLFSDAGGVDFTRAQFCGQVYGGTYIIDYVTVKETDGRLKPNREYLKNIKKGVDQIKTPSPVSMAYSDRVNIVKDGVFKYTTKVPYVSAKGNVMVTAKNIADILDLGYDIADGKYILTKGDVVLTFAQGSADGVSEAPVLKDGQLYIPIKDVLDALGIGYTFDADTLTIG